MTRPKEAGQVLPLVALLLVAVGGAAVWTIRLGGLAAERARASAAADAAALAAAAEGHGGAEQLARANGGRVLSYRVDGAATEVRVGVGRASATARATRERGIAPGGAAPALEAVLARAAQLLGHQVPVARVLGDGLSVDVVPDAASEVARVGAGAGLCRPDPGANPARFRVCGPPATGFDEAGR